MELIVCGLLIGMVAMVWFMVVASLQDRTGSDAGRDVDDEPVLNPDEAASLDSQHTRVAA